MIQSVHGGLNLVFYIMLFPVFGYNSFVILCEYDIFVICTAGTGD